MKYTIRVERNTSYMGILLNGCDSFSAESIAEDLGFEIAQEEKLMGLVKVTVRLRIQ